MGFIPGYEHDIFVSYAHSDDLREVHKSGWVSTFARILESMLTRAFKRELEQSARMINVFWDYKLRGDDQLTPQLSDAVTKSALLLAVMSKNYLNSQWCKNEASWFQDTMQAHSAEPWPIVIVEVQPTDRDAWPKAFEDVVGFKFYDSQEVLNHGNGDTLDLRYAFPNIEVNPDKRFYLEFNRVQSALIKKLREFLTEPPTSPPPLKSSRRIIIAATPDELWRKTWELKKLFGDQNVEVAEIDHKADISSLTESLESELQKGDAFVQLLGRASGWLPELPEGFVVFQSKMAGRAAIPVFQWLDPTIALDNIDVADVAYREMLERRWDSLSRETLDRFSARVTVEVDKPPEPIAKRLLVFVDANIDVHEDYKKVLNTIEELRTQRGCTWVNPLYLDNDVTPSARDRKRKGILKECHGLF